MRFEVEVCEMNTVRVTDLYTGEVEYYSLDKYGSVRACVEQWLKDNYG